MSEVDEIRFYINESKKYYPCTRKEPTDEKFLAIRDKYEMMDVAAMIMGHYDNLKAQLDIAVEALEFYCKFSKQPGPDMAGQSLTKIKEMETKGVKE